MPKKGITDVMLTVKNNSIKNKFKWTIAHTPLSKVANVEKKNPRILSKKWI